MKKIISLAITLAICAAGISAHAETIFTEIAQVKNLPFNCVESNSDVCIAATDYYVSKYESGQWSNAIFDADNDYKITDIHTVDDIFYIAEYSDSLSKGRLLKSSDGKAWEMLAEYSAYDLTRFTIDSDGNILVSCAEGSDLPDGFKRYTAEASKTDTSYFSTIFKDETINIHPVSEKYSRWNYTVTSADGTTNVYDRDTYCSDVALKLDTSNTLTIELNGNKYIAQDYIATECPCVLYKIKEDIKYIVKSGNKYYYTWLYDGSRQRPGTYIYTYEDDEFGNIKRNEEGEPVKEIGGWISQPIMNFKLVNDTFYAEFLYPNDTTRWHCSTDLENWVEC